MVGEMDEIKTWCVNYTYHTKEEKFMTNSMMVPAVTIAEAINVADAIINEEFESHRWSDYLVVNAFLVKEVH